MPTHAEKRRVPYTADEMFGLVADVLRYPEFLPWCLAARIRERQGDALLVDLVIGFKMVRERFTSRVVLDRPQQTINVTYADGPFKHMANHWRFEPSAEGCLIDFYVDFEFKSALLQKLIGVLFNEAVRRMVAAFEARARQLYGERGSPATRQP